MGHIAQAKQRADQPSSQNQVYDVNALFAAREEARQSFAARHGWDMTLEKMGEDSALRRYYRIEKAAKTVLLLDSIPELEDKVAPSHKLKDVVALAPLLREAGLSAPEIYHYDLDLGFALLEDFGDYSFNKALAAGEDEAALYALGAEVLEVFRDNAALNALSLKNYYDGHVHANRVDVVNWYRPAALYEANPDGLMDSYLAAWDEIEGALPPCPMGFTHGDFHVDNLMIVPGRSGLQKCGVLDFQGAMMGPLPYDLANLLEDARKTLPQDLKQHLRAQYCRNMNQADRDLFDTWYRVLATQFHCRVIGLFVRLLVRDNKPLHLHHIPRLQNYIREALADPVLRPLQIWFRDSGIDLSRPLPDFDLPRLRAILGLS